MNREQAKQLLPIIQAFADGADIQFLDPFGKWCPVAPWTEPTFAGETKYRIKPKPIERWLVRDADQYIIDSVFDSEKAAREYINRRSNGWFSIKAPFTYIRVREVTE